MSAEKPLYQNEEWLREQYLIEKRKVVDIAKECNINRITIGRWRKKFGIPSRKFSSEAIAKMSRDKKGKNTNEDNHNWKGDKAGYKVIHDWVKIRKPKPKNCEECGIRKDYLELANISGEYKRDINDYRYLCVKCHKIFDNTLEQFIEGGKKTRFKKGHKNKKRWKK